MPTLVQGSPYTVHNAVEDMFTRAYDDGGGTARTSMNHAVVEVNAEVGESRLSEVNATTGYSRRLQMDNLYNPEDCPHVLLVTGEGLQGAWEAFGDTDHGTGAYRVLLVAYLTQDGAFGSDADAEESLTRQVELFTAAIIRAVRRRGSDGVWGRAGDTLIDVNVSVGRIGTHAVKDDLTAYAARVEYILKIEQDVFY